MTKKEFHSNASACKCIILPVFWLCFLFLFSLPIFSQNDAIKLDFKEISPKFLARKNKLISKIDSLEHSGERGPKLWINKLSLVNLQLVYTKEFKEAKSQIEELILEIDSLNNPIIYGNAMTLHGKSYTVNSEFEKAIDTHFKAINFKERTNNIKTSINYEEIGVTLSAKNNYKEALRYLLIAEEVSKTIGKPRPKLSQRIGRAYNRIGNFDNARIYYEQSIEEAGKLKNQLIQGTSLANLAMLYFEQGKYRLSISNAKESIAIRGKLMGIGHKISITNLLAKNYLELGDLALAKNYALEAWQGVDVLDNKLQQESYGWKQAVLRTIVEIELEMKNDPKLMDYHTELIIAIDSFFNISNTANYHELYTKLDLGEKEKELLKKEVEIEKENRAKQKLIYLAVLLGLLVLSIAYYLRKKIQFEKKITHQNEIISKSLVEKEVLLKEIHHRVKNNLQVVSSLLSIQSRGLRDQKAIDIIAEGKARVHSMSLIHQNLYKENTLSSVEMNNYIGKLTNDLIETYRTSSGKITYRDEVDQIYLDVDTVMPIGLIINELISNVLKHAFPNNKDGEICISLKEKSNQLILELSDNGIGFNGKDIMQKDGSFGHSIIRAFRKKLDATIEINSDMGTTVTIKINNYKRLK